jgi:hypothetical protein
MAKSTKAQKQKWTLNEWRMLYEWMTVHEEIGTPWEEREKLWAQINGVKRSTQSLRGAYNRWKWGWRPQCLKDSDGLSTSFSKTPASAGPEEEQKPLEQTADSSASPTESGEPAQTGTPKMSRLQRRNRRRMISRRVAYQLSRTLTFCRKHHHILIAAWN